ncbi:AAA-like domain-containing protein [Crocosphaera sp.]|uniref:AAA-like domain-containing protein n=1 Tax=Crocosphaera sp. TaxID=2729996 RepID=UPI003F28A8FE|nr:AAA-like domain-containing protein [Crocosphaera sp.]
MTKISKNQTIPKTQKEFNSRYHLMLNPKPNLILRLFLLGFTDEQIAKVCLSFNDDQIADILVCLCKEEITLLFNEMSKEQSQQINKKLNDTNIIERLPNLRGSFDSDILKTAKDNVRGHIYNTGKHFGFDEGEKRERLVQLFWQYQSELVDSSMLTKYGLDFIRSIRDFDQEERCLQDIKETGSLLRIRSPRLMGKTFLINKLLKRLRRNQQYKIVYFTFNSCDSSVLFDYQTLMKSFYQLLIRKMIEDIEDEIAEVKKKQTNLNQSFIEDIKALKTIIVKLKRIRKEWEDLLPPNQNITILFDKLLDLFTENLIVILDDLDKIFDLPYCDDFCGLLRHFFNKAHAPDNNKLKSWRKIHLIIAHSTESYANVNINQSPLANVGETINLKPFTMQQVQSLSKQYNLILEESEFKDLYYLINGHPYLVTLTFNYLKNYSQERLKDIIKSACHKESIYSSYLRGLLAILKQSEDLIDAYGKIVRSTTPISMNDPIIWKLDSLGLIQQDGNNRVTYFCDLYCRYFQENL